MLVQISSGQGPAECQYFVSRLVESLQSEYDDINIIYKSPAVDRGVKGYDLYRSIIFSTECDLSKLEGTMQWIWNSRIRPNHKRKNWFVDVSVIPEVENINLERERHVTVKTSHSGGPGGQNVNKTETAVTVIDEDTGIVVECREERSQYANKQKALKRLNSILLEVNAKNKADQKNDAWRKHTQIERGNPVRIYTGDNFKIKDDNIL